MKRERGKQDGFDGNQCPCALARQKTLLSNIAALLVVLSVVLPASASQNPTGPNELEKMLSGFSKCEFAGVYIDWQTGKGAHPYLRHLSGLGMTVEEDVAYFENIPLRFHGFKVLQLTVPAATWSIHQIVLDAPRRKVRPVLEKALRVRLPRVSTLPADSEETVPLLTEYPGKPNWSVLECNSSL